MPIGFGNPDRTPLSWSGKRLTINIRKPRVTFVKEKEMGCDIHAYLERKFDDGWHTVTPIKGYDGSRGGKRDYAFFSHLCGVRASDSSEDIWPEPKGLPDDISRVVEWEWEVWKLDGHSMSWEPATVFVEKKLALDRLRDAGDKLASNEWEAYKILGWAIDEDGGEDVDNTNLFRVVFWFDN